MICVMLKCLGCLLFRLSKSLLHKGLSFFLLVSTIWRPGLAFYWANPAVLPSTAATFCCMKQTTTFLLARVQSTPALSLS